MSEANREQTTAYLNSIWQNITNDVSKSRNIPAGKLNQYADSMMTLAPQEDYLKTKMVDGLLYTDQVKQLIKKELGIENSEDISQVTVADLQDSNEKEGNKDNQIAIYYAYGDIVDGTVEGLFFPEPYNRCTKSLQRFRKIV